MIRFVCSQCHERLSVADDRATQSAVCPACGTVSRVPLRGFPETMTASIVGKASEIAPRTTARSVSRPAHVARVLWLVSLVLFVFAVWLFFSPWLRTV